jgi:hypothetical protein
MVSNNLKTILKSFSGNCAGFRLPNSSFRHWRCESVQKRLTETTGNRSDFAPGRNLPFLFSF